MYVFVSNSVLLFLCLSLKFLFFYIKLPGIYVVYVFRICDDFELFSGYRNLVYFEESFPSHYTYRVCHTSWPQPVCHVMCVCVCVCVCVCIYVYIYIYIYINSFI